MTPVTNGKLPGGPAEKTPEQIAKEKRILGLWKEYAALLRENPLRSKTELKKYLKEKYGYSSDSGYYAALDRGRLLCAGATGLSVGIQP